MMEKTVIVLPDGSELISGTDKVNAIQSVSITQCVNDSQELTLGSVCANMLEATLITPAGGLPLNAGDELTVYREQGQERRRVGIFLLEKPTRPSANIMKLTAYDYITKLDKDLSEWLNALTDWPYTLYQLAGMVCSQCGLTFANSSIPNGDHPVRKFTVDGVTGRQLMRWIGEACGKFCKATADGKVVFTWYTPAVIQINPKSGGGVEFVGGQLSLKDEGISVSGSDGNVVLNSETITVSHDGDGNLSLTIQTDTNGMYYFQNGLQFEDYTVAPVEKVQIRQTAEDVGYIYPQNATGPLNTYIITGNPLLSASSNQELKPIARSLYVRLNGVSYTPCSIQLPGGSGIEAGNTVSITDSNGKTITAYVMTKKIAGQRETLESTGSSHRDSTTVVNNQSYKDLSGKVLNLRTDVDGIKIENKAADGRVAALELDVDNITTKVANAEGKIASLELGVDGISAQVKNSRYGGTNLLIGSAGYREDRPFERSTKETLAWWHITGMHMLCKPGETYIIQAKTNGVIGNHTGNPPGSSHMYVYLKSEEQTEAVFAGSYPLQLNNLKSFENGRAVWEYTVPTDQQYTEITLRLDIHADGVNTTTVKWWDFKIESGNVCTDWSIAPEDVQSGIAGVEELVLEQVSSLSVQADSIEASVKETKSTVDGIQQDVSKVSQTANSLNVQIQSITDDGVDKVTTSTGYTFNKDGLKISKSGQPIVNLIDNTGMYVKRNENVLLQANDEGVRAVDVTVENYLIVGEHSRFEDYNGGTGCFWI